MPGAERRRDAEAGLNWDLGFRIYRNCIGFRSGVLGGFWASFFGMKKPSANAFCVSRFRWWKTGYGPEPFSACASRILKVLDRICTCRLLFPLGRPYVFAFWRPFGPFGSRWSFGIVGNHVGLLQTIFGAFGVLEFWDPTT